MHDLGQIVRQACARQGLDLSDLASQAGISRTTLYHLLEGHTSKPRLGTLKRLADSLEIPVDELLGGSGRGSIPAGGGATGPAPASDAARDFDRLTNPAVDQVAEERPDLFRGWTEHDWDELRSMFGTGGGLHPLGVIRAAEAINHQRETVRKLRVVLETHLAEVASALVEALYQLVRAK